MASKKRKKPAATKAAAPSNGLSKKQKADITRFVRDVAAEYSDKYPKATVFRLRRAIHNAPALRDQVLELGGRAWMRDGFRSDIVDLIEKLPDTQFRASLTPEEREKRDAARRKALVNDVRSFALSADSVAALRVAFAKGLTKDTKRTAYEAFDKQAAKAPG